MAKTEAQKIAQARYMVDWRARNAARKKEYAAKWYADNKDHSKARSAKWKADNKARIAEYNRQWDAAHPEAKRIREHNRNARKRANGGRLSPDIVEKLFTLQRGKCPCCKKALGSDFQLDHRIPVALGGPNEDWNMQLLRKGCNNQKRAKHPVDFMRSRGFLL